VLGTREETPVAVTTTSIKLDTQHVDEATRVLGAKSRTEAVRTALQEIVALRSFKKLMKKHAGKPRGFSEFVHPGSRRC